MRSIEEPFVVARPAGVRIRTRLRLSAADQAVVRMVGEYLGEPRALRTGWVVEVADPWGNVIGLTDYRHTPERARRRAGATSS
jgi:hypothetical protein